MTHGLAAALLSLSAFYIAGRIFFSHRVQAAVRWPEAMTCGMALFVLLCWIATSSRHIRVIYVILLFAAAVWGMASLRFKSLRDTTTPGNTHAVRDWAA